MSSCEPWISAEMAVEGRRFGNPAVLDGNQHESLFCPTNSLPVNPPMSPRDRPGPRYALVSTLFVLWGCGWPCLFSFFRVAWPKAIIACETHR
jgi:hypothetical protein